MIPSLRVACLLLPLLAACSRSSDVPPDGAPAPAAARSAAVAAAAPAAATAMPERPTLQVTTIDGQRYDLAAHRGHWVVVNFWATWCAPCLKEMPDLSALDAMREHVEVVGLAYEDTTPAAMRAFLEAHPVVYPVAILDTFDPPRDFATPRGLPMTYLIAPDGKVAHQFLGPVTAHDVEVAIAEAGGPALQASVGATPGQERCPDTAQHYRDRYVSTKDPRDLSCHRRALEREARL